MIYKLVQYLLFVLFFLQAQAVYAEEDLTAIFNAWLKNVENAEQFGCTVISRGLEFYEPTKTTKVSYRKSDDGFVCEIFDNDTNQLVNAFGMNRDYRFAISKKGNNISIDELVTRLDNKDFAEKYQPKRIDGLTHWGASSLIRLPPIADLAELNDLGKALIVKSTYPVGDGLTGINFEWESGKLPQFPQKLLRGVLVVENDGSRLPREVHLQFLVKKIKTTREDIEAAVKDGRFIGRDGKKATMSELPSIIDAFEKQADEMLMYVDGYWECEEINGVRLPKTFRSPKDTKERPSNYTECEQEITDRLFEKPASSSFRLTHYGLPEPKGLEKSKNWYSWILLGVLILGLGAALRIGYVRKRPPK